MFLHYASYVIYWAMHQLGRGSAEKGCPRRTKGVSAIMGRGKLPASQDQHPKAENGLLTEVG